MWPDDDVSKSAYSGVNTPAFNLLNGFVLKRGKLCVDTKPFVLTYTVRYELL
jgi:hypothetical protein